MSQQNSDFTMSSPGSVKLEPIVLNEYTKENLHRKVIAEMTGEGYTPDFSSRTRKIIQDRLGVCVNPSESSPILIEAQQKILEAFRLIEEAEIVIDGYIDDEVRLINQARSESSHKASSENISPE